MSQDSIDDLAATRRNVPGPRFSVGDFVAEDFRIEEPIGRGAFGEVWRARDLVADVDVALKTLPPEVAGDAHELERVRRAYQLVHEIRHPNVVGLRALRRDAASGSCVLVMDYVRGRTLAQHLAARPEGRIAPAHAVEILVQVAAALDHAHGHRVVHRDVKPANILLGEDGSVRVADFGLATEIRSSLGRVSKRELDTSGTRPYMAPEQWRGEPADGATDQYALAVVFHEMVSGRVPFEASDPAVLREIVLKEAPRPLAELSPARNAALLRALAKERAERFPSCGAFVEALEGAGASPVVAAPAKRSTGGGTLPRGAVVLAVGLVSLLVAGTWLGLGGVRPTAEPASLASLELPADSNILVFNAASDRDAHERLREVLRERLPRATVDAQYDWKGRHGMARTSFYFLTERFRGLAKALDASIPGRQQVIDYHDQRTMVGLDADRDLAIFLGNDFEEVIATLRRELPDA